MLEKKVMLTQALWIAMLFRLFVYSISGSKRQHLKLSLHCTSPSFPTLFQCQASVIEKKRSTTDCVGAKDGMDQARRAGRRGFLKDTFVRDRCLTQKQDTADQLCVSFSSSLLTPIGILPVHVTSNFGNKMPFTGKEKSTRRYLMVADSVV